MSDYVVIQELWWKVVYLWYVPYETIYYMYFLNYLYQSVYHIFAFLYSDLDWPEI